MNDLIQKTSAWLDRYVYSPGDGEEVLLQKKLWWLGHMGGLPILLIASLIIGARAGMAVAWLNGLLFSYMLGDLIVFHFYRKGIEWYALGVQLAIVILTSIKAYLLGGLLHAGAPIYFGLIGPIYALTLPKKRRALLVFLLYLLLMMGGTLLHPGQELDYQLFYYFFGFTFATSQIFAALYYYASQVEKLKREEKQRMYELDAFKTRFYSDLTHEFRTPLTIIIGMAEQVRKTPEVWLDEGSQMIAANGRKLLNLINQMLELSKLEAGALPIHLIRDDILVFLKYLVESFDSLARSKRIRLSFTSTQEALVMDFDPDKIQHIVSNLLSNAIRFTPPSGEVKVQIAEEGESPAGFLVIRVEDTGIGIRPEDLPHVFDRYFQGNTRPELLAEGSGLGLALTREMVKLCGGTITAESPAPGTGGQGAVFTVRLPITQRAPAARALTLQKTPAAAEAADPSDGSQIAADGTDEKLLILIVDDNADVVHYLRALLAGAYRVETAGDGQTGYEKAIRLIPDLVISDVMMPVMDGIDLCRKLKADLRTSHVPVVLLTAKAGAAPRVEGLEAGADAYLVKPFDREELFVRIRKLIELRRALQDRYRDHENWRTGQTPPANSALQREDAFLLKVRQTLEEHLSDEAFGIAELGRSLGMSRSQLYRKFQALTNTTVHHFIRRLRLYRARRLLRQTDLNITQVAFESGFKNLSHFSKIFSAEFGCSPTQYRQNGSGTMGTTFGTMDKAKEEQADQFDW